MATTSVSPSFLGYALLKPYRYLIREVYTLYRSVSFQGTSSKYAQISMQGIAFYLYYLTGIALRTYLSALLAYL